MESQSLHLAARGGPRIISAVVQVLLRVLWFGDEPIEAIRQTRLHHQWLPNRVYVEQGSKIRHIEEHLQEVGHAVRKRKNIGVVQVIQIEEGMIKPASDPRKGGKPAGF